MEYFYSTMRGNAVLSKGDDKKLVAIGKFKTEKQARDACEAHYKRACKTLQTFGKQIPKAYFL